MNLFKSMGLLIEEFFGLVLRAVAVVLGLLGVAVCMVECADDPYDRYDPYNGVTDPSTPLRGYAEAGEAGEGRGMRYKV